MSWVPKPSGEAPISPDKPFDEAAYEAMIAAMEALIARADEPYLESQAKLVEEAKPKADEPREVA